MTAESCAAGKLAALLSEAPGATEHLHGSFVTYTKANKVKALGIDAGLLKAKGAVCREVAEAMAEGGGIFSSTSCGFVKNHKGTGPRTSEGLERSRRANWKHGYYSREAKAERSRVRAAIVALRYLRMLGH